MAQEFDEVESDVEDAVYEKTDLRISTMVITAHWGTAINLDQLFEMTRAHLIPIRADI